MSEWWTYRLSDFLLFSPRIYHRLFELYNTDYWPMHLAAMALGGALCVAGMRGHARAGLAMLAVCWLWVAWAFHLQRYATINWAATWFAAAFAIEGALLLLASILATASHVPARRGAATHIGLGLLLLALVAMPFLVVLQGRPWAQAEVFGMAPDPTAVGTMGALLLIGPQFRWRWLLWPLPVLWCLVGAATAWTLRTAG